jgi:zinc finger protein AEBP2
MLSSGNTGSKGSFAAVHQNGYHKPKVQDLERSAAALEIPCRCPVATRKRQRQQHIRGNLCNNAGLTGVVNGLVPFDTNSSTPDVSVACDSDVVSICTPLNETSDQASVSESSDCSSLPTKDEIVVSLLSADLSEDSKNGSLSATENVHGSLPGAEKLVRCNWNKCGQSVETDDLLEHIHTCHVMSQVKPATNGTRADSDEQTFVCLWKGCKVYNRPSCLFTWLERHIVCHLGDKPHRCIVAGCGARFASQLMLERHVNAHFSGTCSTSLAASRPPRKGDTGSKSTKKRKLRSVRLCPVRADDYFDSKVMDLIQKQFITYAESPQAGSSISGNLIPFRFSVIARRTAVDGQSEVLVHWSPANVLPDEWLRESDITSLTTRELPLSCLPNDFICELFTLPKPGPSSLDGFHRHRRK